METYIFEVKNFHYFNKSREQCCFSKKVSKIDDIALTMTFELYMDLMWEESRIIINETSPYWGGDGSFMGSTNFVPKMWLPDIQIYMCKQFRKRQIVTDVAGLIIFKNRQVLYTVSTEVESEPVRSGQNLEQNISGHHRVSHEVRSFSARPSDLQVFGKNQNSFSFL